MSNEVLNKSIQSAWLNILMSVWIRLFTFIFDAVFLRYVTQEYLGIGVRMTLLTDTLLFLSREPFRRACLKKPENEDWKGIINLVWLTLPISACASLGLGYVWMHVLEPPDSYLDQYHFAIKMNCFSILILLCTEPFYIIGEYALWFKNINCDKNAIIPAYSGQAYMHVKFRTVVDLSWATCGHFLMVGVAVFDPENGIYLGAFGMLLNCSMFLCLHLAYFSRVLATQDPVTTPKGNTDQYIQLIDRYIPCDADCFYFFLDRLFHPIPLHERILAQRSSFPDRFGAVEFKSELLQTGFPEANADRGREVHVHRVQPHDTPRTRRI